VVDNLHVPEPAHRGWHGAYPHGLRLSPDGRELYVANVLDGSVSVIDVAAQKVIKTIQVGELPWGMTIAQP
jgi:YVTN family beta-propeller protein